MSSDRPSDSTNVVKRPVRNRQPASKISDTANAETPSATHLNALATKPILDLIKKTRKLSVLLPETIPEATDTDKIHRVITTVNGIEGTIAGTFNRCFDILFGEDCRGGDGRLKNIRRGALGMTCMVDYLESIHWALPAYHLTSHRSNYSVWLRSWNIFGMFHLLGGDALTSTSASSNVKRAARSGSSKTPTEAPPEASDDEEETPHSEWDRAMDVVWDCAVNGRRKGTDDNAYKPRRTNRELSEEEEDDFDLVELDKPATPEGSRKHKKVLVVDDGNGSAAEQLAVRY
ncbi:hypothetical protein B0H17DRAFT_1127725 [Mycena rosella]|uniref:Uncharacterized protein n=1 Tax=Mycena rosella TaxID=1033263 RepID=A0AAD7E003_MYCRO|nr:hypothetical protein B0H17DRAFT_1127725 [Mycena rosella]